MEKYKIIFTEEEIPKYIQISSKIKKMIDENQIEDGEKLLPIRQFAKLLGVNMVTVVTAYKKLQSEGYAIQKMGSGTYAKRKEVTKNFKSEYGEVLKKLSGKSLKQYIDFTGETASSDFFPVVVFKNILNEVLDRDGAEALVYQELLGYEGLRESINNFFWKGKIDIDNILIVSGAQQGIDIVSKAIINISDTVVVEKPTYGGALSVFKGRRANVVEIEMLKDGADLLQFEKIIKKNKIKCFYTMSYFQNPTGATYSMEKKKALLKLANEYDFYIIEDDYLSELIYDSSISYKSFKSLDENDRVIYIKSFSKIFLPGIRIGYLIAPKLFKEPIQNSKINTDISTSSLMQRALELYINKGFWKNYIVQLNEIYGERYKVMEETIAKTFGNKITFFSPGGGLSFYLKIANQIPIDSKQLFYASKAKNVLITPGVLFYRHSKEGEKYFRLSFSQTSPENIKKGLEIVNEILRV